MRLQHLRGLRLGRIRRRLAGPFPAEAFPQSSSIDLAGIQNFPDQQGFRDAHQRIAVGGKNILGLLYAVFTNFFTSWSILMAVSSLKSREVARSRPRKISCWCFP